MTSINWDTNEHPYKYHKDIKKIYDREIIKNRKNSQLG